MIKLCIAILILLSTFGCSLTLPDEVWIVNSPYPNYQVLEAVDDFAYAWDSHFQKDISPHLKDFTVEFYQKNNWGQPGCVTGETKSLTKIRVGYPSDTEDWPLNATAFWHELVHMTLWNIPTSLTRRAGDPDVTHEQGDGPWTDKHNEMISELKANWIEKYGL